MTINKSIYIIILFSFNILAQNTFYISSSSGNDANSGLTENTAWKSVSKISNHTNSTFLFKAGDIFKEKVKCNSGNTYGKYGIGSNPKFAEGGRIFEIQNIDNVTIQDIEVEGTSWLWAENSDNLQITNVYFHHYKDPSSFDSSEKYVSNIPFYIYSCDYFTLQNSKIEGNFLSTYQDMMTIEGSSQYIFISNNTIIGGSHNSLQIYGNFKDQNDRLYNDDSPHHVIIRNNYFRNPFHHCLSTNVGAWMTLIEGNYFERAGTGIDSSAYYQKYKNTVTIGSAIYHYGSGILRNNIICRSGSNQSNKGIDGNVRYATDGRRSEVFDQAIYHNVFWNNFFEAYKTGIYHNVSTGWADNLKYENISFVNNSFGGSNNLNDNDIFIFKSNTQKDYNGDYRNNSFEKPYIRYRSGSGDQLTIEEFNNNPPGIIEASGNINIKPNFLSPNSIPEDQKAKTALTFFKPGSNSELINNGDFLTYSTNSGSNAREIKVKDPKFFMDGWGIVDGDVIQIGNNIVSIVEVDYTNKILVVDQNISWENNQGISLPYYGSKPDIGLSESLFEENPGSDIVSFATPTIIEQPTDVYTSLGENAIFNIVVANTDNVGYSWWKYNINTENFIELSDNDKYSGTNTNSLIINNISSDDFDIQFYCEVFNTSSPNSTKLKSSSVGLYNNSTEANGLLVFIEGGYQNNLLNNNFTKNGILPENHPYNIAPWNYNVDDKVITSDTNIVDWILVELRKDKNIISYQKTGLLTKNGIIINSNGEPFSFENIQSDKYYLTIRHYNHLDIMSASPIEFSSGININYDFTNAKGKALGNDPMKDFGDGKFGMYAGDADGNNIINNLDFGAVANKIPSRGYFSSDLDMNCTINVLDYNLIKKNILKSSYVPY